MPFIISNGAGCFMMHDHFYAFAFCIIPNGGYIKIGIRRYKIKYIIFGFAKPVFPAYIPAFYQYGIKTICGGIINHFFYMLCSCPMFAIGCKLGIIGNAQLYRRHLLFGSMI